MRLKNIKCSVLTLTVLALLAMADTYAQTCSGAIRTVGSGQTCTGSTSGMSLNSLASVTSITNSGTIIGNSSTVDGIGIFNNNGTLGSVFNNLGGVISGVTTANLAEAYGFYSNGGRNTFLFNAGVISGSSSGSSLISGGYGIFLNGGTFDHIVNTGAIIGNARGVGIYSNGSAFTTLSNNQGGNASSPSTTALTFGGNLPTNYNVIIRSFNNYGQLAASNPFGVTTFGIYAGGVTGVEASALNKGTYSSVLSGFSASNLTGATSGNYNGFTWRLNNSSGSIWDLIVTGASTVDTQQSLINTSAALQNIFTLQNTVLANSFSYDCNVFGENNVCVSAGGRNTAVSAANGLNNTSALLIAAYRVAPSIRVGVYADQNLSVNNAGSTVNLGNNTPLVGLFGAWNERLDGTGAEVKVSAAYGQKNTTVTRQVVGTSEAGSGSAQLNSQGAQVIAKYGFGVTPDVIVSPYLGMRYTQNNMGSYSEQITSSVTAPLTYSAVNTNATTALAGVGAQYRFIPKAAAFASVGVETDTNSSNGIYSATGIVGLSSINFNANPVQTRPTATLGAFYDVEKKQRLGITGIYRQEPYQSVQTTTVMLTYTIGM